MRYVAKGDERCRVSRRGDGGRFWLVLPIRDLGQKAMTVRPFGEMVMPAASKTLGWRMISIDAKKGEIELGFDGKAEFANPAGIIQGGMVAAMIDDAMASIVIAHFAMKKMPSTIDLHVHYLRPVRIGPVTVKAKIAERGRTTVFVEAELFESRGKRAAKASSAITLIDMDLNKAS
jgi:uncharacterized protein (TIGR00369 family)